MNDLKNEMNEDLARLARLYSEAYKKVVALEEFKVLQELEKIMHICNKIDAYYSNKKEAEMTDIFKYVFEKEKFQMLEPYINLQLLEEYFNISLKGINLYTEQCMIKKFMNDMQTRIELTEEYAKYNDLKVAYDKLSNEYQFLFYSQK